MKAWENRGGWIYKGNGEFDLAAELTWEKGKFVCDDEEFEFANGDGSSLYTYFYKDGEVVGSSSSPICSPSLLKNLALSRLIFFLATATRT